MESFAITYLYDYNEGYKLVGFNRFDSLEDAKRYKESTESGSEGCLTVEIYEAKLIDYTDFDKKALG